MTETSSGGVVVIVAMNDALRCAGLRTTVESQIGSHEILNVTTSAELKAQLRDAPQCRMLLIDLDFEPGVTLQAIEAVRSECPTLPILAFEFHAQSQRVVRALRCGATGVVSAGASETDICTALGKMMAGRRYVSQDGVGNLLDSLSDVSKTENPHDTLSAREFEILCLFGSGLSNKGAAEVLKISVKTVSAHKARIQTKLNVRSMRELIHYALRHMLCGPMH